MSISSEVTAGDGRRHPSSSIIDVISDPYTAVWEDNYVSIRPIQDVASEVNLRVLITSKKKNHK